MTELEYWKQEAERRWKKIIRVDELMKERPNGKIELCEDCKALVRKALWKEK